MRRMRTTHSTSVMERHQFPSATGHPAFLDQQYKLATTDALGGMACLRHICCDCGCRCAVRTVPDLVNDRGPLASAMTDGNQLNPSYKSTLCVIDGGNGWGWKPVEAKGTVPAGSCQVHVTCTHESTLVSVAAAVRGCYYGLRRASRALNTGELCHSQPSLPHGRRALRVCSKNLPLY
jgi:hypothetical protein